MLGDIVTIMWKEWKELLIRRGRARRGALGLLILILLIAIAPPIQAGRAWIESPLTVMVASWIPLFLIMGNVCDAFAGERERHTLETLLASCLSDKAILFGKVAAVVSYGWGLSLMAQLLSLLTVNIFFWDGHILIYTPAICTGIFTGSLLSAGLAAGTGILASLRAPTVRQARQRVSFAFMLLTVPALGMQALPLEWRNQMAEMPSTLDPGKILLMLAGVFFLIDAALLTIAFIRFNRTQLITE
jgi:ABC-2 type transport system permease protein